MVDCLVSVPPSDMGDNADADLVPGPGPSAPPRGGGGASAGTQDGARDREEPVRAEDRNAETEFQSWCRVAEGASTNP